MERARRRRSARRRRHDSRCVVRPDPDRELPQSSGSPLGRHAIASAVLSEEADVRIVGIPHLVALKLYAGGPKSRADIVELLSRNPDADLQAIRAVCAHFHLSDDLESLLAELG